MTCYGPLGENLSGWPVTPWYPCNYTTADGFVPCCQPAIGACQANKACSYTVDGADDVLIRGGCTDRTFKSKSCPQFLLDGETRLGANGNIIHDCGNGTGCYNLSNHGIDYSDYNCSCQQEAPNLLLIEYDTIVYASAVSSSSTQTNGSPTTASQTPVLSSTTVSFSDTTTAAGSTIGGSKSTSAPTSTAAPGPTDLGIKIGVPIGVIGGLVLAVVLGFLLGKRRRQQLPIAEKRLLQSSEPGVAVY